jgi:ABC-type uncharacterized transport system involved in gliding motility auxiliary subunit
MKKYNQIPIIVIGLVILNLISSSFYKRFDLTSDTRYTLSEVTNTILDKIDEPVIVRVYLEGDFPSEFKRLQTETRQHLEELKAINDNIRFKFVDPLDQAEELDSQPKKPATFLKLLFFLGQRWNIKIKLKMFHYSPLKQLQLRNNNYKALLKI